MLILTYQGALTTAFEEPTRALSEALTGVPVLLPREERALALITSKFGHPVSRLYVDAAFTDEQKAKAVDMIARIQETFAARIPTRDWLSEQTCTAALEKLDAFTIRVGYTDDRIDHSGVEIGGDLVADLAPSQPSAFCRRLQPPISSPSCSSLSIAPARQRANSAPDRPVSSCFRLKGRTGSLTSMDRPTSRIRRSSNAHSTATGRFSASTSRAAMTRGPTSPPVLRRPRSTHHGPRSIICREQPARR